MNSGHSIDEVALNTLLADGVDAPTTYTASIRDKQPAARKAKDHWFTAGMIIGGLLCLLWLLFR